MMPELFLKLNELIKAHENEKACELQHAVNSIIYKMCSGHGNMYAVAKEMLRINAGLDIGSVREPLTGLNDADREIAAEAAAMVRETIEKYV